MNVIKDALAGNGENGALCAKRQEKLTAKRLEQIELC